VFCRSSPIIILLLSCSPNILKASTNVQDPAPEAEKQKTNAITGTLGGSATRKIASASRHFVNRISLFLLKSFASATDMRVFLSLLAPIFLSLIESSAGYSYSVTWYDDDELCTDNEAIRSLNAIGAEVNDVLEQDDLTQVSD
jgi:hypothetical protein